MDLPTVDEEAVSLPNEDQSRPIHDEHKDGVFAKWQTGGLPNGDVETTILDPLEGYPTIYVESVHYQSSKTGSTRAIPRFEKPWTSLVHHLMPKNQIPDEKTHQLAISQAPSESSYEPSETNSSVFFSAKSTISGRSIPSRASLKRVKFPRDTGKSTAYKKQLAEKQLWPVDPSLEQNWSGRGQHAEFDKTERKLLDSILQVQDLLGSSSSAIVQSVKCKRILLARKTIRCIPGRHMTREKAIDEVAHLTKLRHSHIVRVIGTYVLGHDISILLYPVAEYTLQTFLAEMMREPGERDPFFNHEGPFATTFMGCLSNALAHVHQHLIKHMDIKPQNILLRKIKKPSGHTTPFRVYLADFGIARSYKNHESTETEGPTMFTRKYAAPEVVDREKRGLPADVFSLGCVFLEMLAADVDVSNKLKTTHASSLEKMLASNVNGDTSYQANLESLPPTLDLIRRDVYNPDLWPFLLMTQWLSKTEQMMNKDPSNRPTAGDLVRDWIVNDCCLPDPEDLEAAPEPTPSR